MKKALALLSIATVFGLNSCGIKSAETPAEDILDFDVIAMTATGDTLFHIVTDNIRSFQTYGKTEGSPLSVIRDHGSAIIEKSTGNPYLASPGTTVVARPIAPVK